MVTTGNGRTKIVMQDLVNMIEQIHEAQRDPEAVHVLEDQLKDLALLGIQSGDFQGLSAKTAAKLALSTGDVAEGKRRKA